MQQNGLALVASAVILAVAIVAASWVVSSSLGDVTDSLEEISLALDDVKDGLALAPSAAPTRAEARKPARRGLDPNRKYTVKTDGSPMRGSVDAKVTVVEFSDFQCPFCSRTNPTLARLRQEYGDALRIVFKHMPLESIHPRAPAAHKAAEAAKLQGKFWEMHDKIFENQRSLSNARYLEFAKEIGLDIERFKKDQVSSEVAERVESDVAEASALGVTGTPAFFINGKPLSGARPYPDFKRVVDAALKGSEEGAS
jgi:protein-disulfide isomerase